MTARPSTSAWPSSSSPSTPHTPPHTTMPHIRGHARRRHTSRRLTRGGRRRRRSGRGGGPGPCRARSLRLCSRPCGRAFLARESSLSLPPPSPQSTVIHCYPPTTTMLITTCPRHPTNSLLPPPSTLPTRLPLCYCNMCLTALTITSCSARAKDQG